MQDVAMDTKYSMNFNAVARTTIPKGEKIIVMDIEQIIRQDKLIRTAMFAAIDKHQIDLKSAMGPNWVSAFYHLHLIIYVNHRKLLSLRNLKQGNYTQRNVSLYYSRGRGGGGGGEVVDGNLN